MLTATDRLYFIAHSPIFPLSLSLSLSLKWLATVAVCLAACSKWRHYDDLIFIFASENDAKTSKNSLDIDSVWLTFAVICILLMLSLMSIACRYVISIFFSVWFDNRTILFYQNLFLSLFPFFLIIVVIIALIRWDLHI